MAPTLIYRFAHQNDFKQGIFSCNYPSSLKSKLKADMANSTTWCRGTLDGSRMPNSAGEPDFESSIYTDDIRFGCTQAQYEEWWSDKDHIEAEKRHVSSILSSRADSGGLETPRFCSIRARH